MEEKPPMSYFIREFAWPVGIMLTVTMAFIAATFWVKGLGLD